MSNNQKGIVALFASATLYGFFGVFSRIISFNIPFFYQTWLRNLGVIVIIAIPLLILKSWKKIKKGDLKWFVLRSLAGFVSFIGTYFSFNNISFGTVYFIYYASSTICGFMLGKILFEEKINRIKIFAFTLSIIGLYLVYQETARLEKSVFTLVVFIAGFAGAGWNIFSKKISGDYSNIQINFIDTVFAWLLPFVFSVFLKERWAIPTYNNVWFATALFGLLFLTTGFLMVYGFKYVEAQKGSLIMLFDVILGIFFGYLFFKEVPSLISIFGGGLILLAIILPNVSLVKSKSS